MSEELNVEIILFDWGGTLAGVTREADNWRNCALAAAEAIADTTPLCPQAAADPLAGRFAVALASARKDPEHREIDTRTLLLEWAGEIDVASPESGPIDRAMDAYWRQWIGILDPIEAAADALAELKHGGYRLGLVSNVAAPVAYANAELERLGFRQWLDACTFSSEIGYRKPHSAIYDAAVARASAPAPPPEPDRILFVGDGPIHDVTEPQRRGMKTALVRYEGLPWPTEQLRAARPDLRIDHVAELLDALPPRANNT